MLNNFPIKFNGRNIDLYAINTTVHKTFLLALSVSLIFSCNTSGPAVGNPAKETSAEFLAATWDLEMLFASDNNWATTPYININVRDKTFSGNAGCNSVSGKFMIIESYIEFDKNILSTKMACAGNNENIFLSALLKVNKYTILKEELELSQGEIVLMKFKKGRLRLP